MTCSCNGVVVTGCNMNLWALNSCPVSSPTSIHDLSILCMRSWRVLIFADGWGQNDDNQGSCMNPDRANNAATGATTFFAPCAGAAYTYPGDSGANNPWNCQNGVIVCCVGTACPANPKQARKQPPKHHM
jgi:hypothetical protein